MRVPSELGNTLISIFTDIFTDISTSFHGLFQEDTRSKRVFTAAVLDKRVGGRPGGHQGTLLLSVPQKKKRGKPPGVKLSAFMGVREKQLPSVITLESATSWEAVFAPIPARSGGPNGAEKIALLSRSGPSKQQIQFVLRRRVSPQRSLVFF